MHINPRRQKPFKKIIVIYISLLVVLVGGIFLFNYFVPSSKPLFISPLGKVNSDIAIVEKNLKEKNITFSKVKSQQDFYVVDIPNNGQVKLSATKDIGKQISSLQRILLALTIEGKPFKSIDFRFEEPIISF